MPSFDLVIGSLTSLESLVVLILALPVILRLTT